MNRKLTLDMDALVVASFSADVGAAAHRGTVDGREGHAPCPFTIATSCPKTQINCLSVDITCPNG